jgi:5S rRNA maturation endonuclease (ribonuclease M5)
MEERELYFEQFRRNFQESDIAKEYYSSRKLSKSLFDEQQIAYCPIYSRYSFPYLKGRLIVPIRNIYGEIIALAGRQIPANLDKSVEALYEKFSNDSKKCQERINKYKKGKWINEPYVRNRNIYFLDKAKIHARQKNYIILMEGYFDVLSFYDNGIKNVSALCGTSISDYQIALISRFCDNVVVLMDSDAPGKTASIKIVHKIKEMGLNAYRVFLPTNLDPDDFAAQYDINFLDEAIQNNIAEKKQDLTIYGK